VIEYSFSTTVSGVPDAEDEDDEEEDEDDPDPPHPAARTATAVTTARRYPAARILMASFLPERRPYWMNAPDHGQVQASCLLLSCSPVVLKAHRYDLRRR
jgi:hypothetical protein